MTRDLYQISPKSIKKYRKYGQKYIDALQYKCQSEIVDRWMCSTHKASFLYLVKKKKKQSYSHKFKFPTAQIQVVWNMSCEYV